MVKKLLALVLLAGVVFTGLSFARRGLASTASDPEPPAGGGVPVVPIDDGKQPKARKAPADYDAETRKQAGKSTGTGMTPVMRARLRKALRAAAGAGVELSVTSGWRSSARQQRLFDEAVVRYGSKKAASRWVLPPGDSMHVRGRAVDVGPAAGMAWLEQNGWRWGLCRRYDNEPWHFEPLTRPGYACPPRQSAAVAS